MQNLRSSQILILLGFVFFTLTSCEGMPGADARKYPPDPKKRVKKNLEEGRGFRLDNALGGAKKGGDFMFASSNELWRASLDVLDFMPLTSANYSGGIIITDWYSENNSNDAIKITVRFLANEVRSDSLKISVHKKECKSNMNCRTNLLKNSAIGNELRTSIIRKAAILERESKDKKKK